MDGSPGILKQAAASCPLPIVWGKRGYLIFVPRIVEIRIQHDDRVGKDKSSFFRHRALRAVVLEFLGQGQKHAPTP